MRLGVLLALALSGCATTASVRELEQRMELNVTALALALDTHLHDAEGQEKAERAKRETICQRFEEYQVAKEGRITHPCRPGQSVTVDVQPIRAFGSIGR